MIRCSKVIEWLYPRSMCSGILSKYAGFELFVTGHVGAKEIDNLIKQLEFYKSIFSYGKEGEIGVPASSDPSRSRGLSMPLEVLPILFAR